MVGFATLLVLGLGVVTASPVVGPEVVGGENAAQGEFPFVVSVQYNGYHICGGSVISDQWVLTAGHCLEVEGGATATDLEIYYGDFRLSDSINNRSSANIAKVSKYFTHPNFTHEESPSILIRNDLALIKLEHPLNFSANVQPIKLPEQDEPVPVYSTATLTGWGMKNMWEATDFLQKVDLIIFDYPYCDQTNEGYSFDNDQNVCAGTIDNTKGQCSGDSGGPLFVNGVQWGIVSWSIKPCISAPGVFTRTSFFVDWIKSVMASN